MNQKIIYMLIAVSLIVVSCKSPCGKAKCEKKNVTQKVAAPLKEAHDEPVFDGKMEDNQSVAELEL